MVDKRTGALTNRLRVKTPYLYTAALSFYPELIANLYFIMRSDIIQAHFWKVQAGLNTYLR